jgi:von Willebrand factor type A domain
VVIAVAALLILLLSGVGAVATRSGLLAQAADHLPWSSPRRPCASTDVGVVVAPEIAPVVLQTLNPISGRPLPDGTCLRVDVQTQDPAKTVTNAAGTATADLPQVWIPDSSLWLGLASAWPARPVGSLATSPVVLATSRTSLGRLGWAGRAVTWPEGLANTHTVVAPSVTDDASTLLALLAMAQTLGPGVTTQQRIAASVLAASAQPARDLASAIDLARAGGSSAPVMVTSEHRVGDANKDRPGGLVVVHPVAPRAQLDFPIARVGRPSDDPIVSAGAGLVVQALTTPAARQAAASAGFGPPSPAVAPQTAAAQAAQRATAAKVAAFVTELRTLALPSRLLTVVDVSLSMGQPVQPGFSRIRLAANAALGVRSLFPDGSAIGLWAFAGRQGDGKTYRELAKVDLLASPDHLVPGDGLTHRDVVERGLATLPRLLSPGGTALYDTTLAALREARDQYDPQANNAVVVFTDGANDYDRGITLRQFQEAARKDVQAHPDRGVLLIAIGIGPQADMAALKAMCAAAGGRAYRADNVQSLRQVLFDAIAHRPIQSS